MIKNYAMLNNGVVQNIIVIDDEDTEILASFDVVEIPAGMNVCAGWLYSGGVFTKAEPIPLPVTIAMLQSQIDSLERAAMLPRPVREFLILAAQKEAAAIGLTEPQLYAANLAYKRVKDFDNEIVVLRTQMEALP